MKKIIASIVIVICCLVAFSSIISIEWLYDTFESLSMEEIVFHLRVPMKGTSTDMINKFIADCLIKITASTLIFSFILIYPMINDLKIIPKIKTSERKRTIIISMIISVLLLSFSVNSILNKTDILKYINNQKNESMLIENEYIDPRKVSINFPEEKRNLIYIYLESMETTYYSKKDGGLSNKDLIPEISKLAKENISFSSNNKLGGAYTLSGTTWTVGAMTAQTSGVPLKLSVGINDLSEYKIFLPGAYSIGEVLKDNGYNNLLLLGSDAEFGGRENLFKQHGDYKIWDVHDALAEGKIESEIWWGYTDKDLFEFAKEKILELAQKNEPFNFTTLTTDTHFQDGYKCDDCPDIWDKQYKNVISCSSKKVYEFINWIKQQEFYENTTIVIAGDHLTMQSGFFELEEGQEYDKKVINVIINSAVEETNTNRVYSTMDLYPTTLAALGAKIEGNRLALGTNLFSDEKTLIEKYGLQYVNDELLKVSKFYDNNILVERK